MTSNLRPDERAALAQIERSKSFDTSVKSGLKKAAGLGTLALGAGTGLASKILPFLSEFIPPDLAIKGINKLSPKVGSFLKKGMSQGLDIKEGFNFLKENFSQKKAPEQRNILQQYSPELHEFITGEIQKGHSPLEAGALAEIQDKFKKSIKKMSEDHKAPFSSILESIFGSGENAPKQEALQRFKQHQKKPGMMEEERQRFQQEYGPMLAQGQQQQPGQGQQALQAILQKINQRLGG